MANIKFSQFTVGNVESDIDFVVGYKGGDNIQISPANLLSATLTGYLPLTGGTMTGNIKYNSGVRAQFGNGGNSEIFYTGTNFVMSTFTGDMIISNYTDDKDIIFQSDDGSGGVTQYFKLDGSLATGSRVYTVFPDNSTAVFGTGFDFQIHHDASNTYLQQGGTGDLYFQQNVDDRDIIFQSDDGSGGIAEYFRVDGSSENVLFSKLIKLSDNVELRVGDGNDLKIYHDGTDSIIRQTGSGDLYIKQEVDDKDIIFQCDDGAGGVETYFFLDGSAGGSNPRTIFPDNSRLCVGTGEDLNFTHDGTNTFIQNDSGDLTISNRADDKDIIFQSDDGSGGVAEYFRVKGSVSTAANKYTVFPDNSVLAFGNSQDFRIYHSGSNTYINNVSVGNVYFDQSADDKDIIFRCDDGSGGVTTYFYLDGSQGTTRFEKNARWQDGKLATFGDGDDLQIYHNGTNSVINNITNNLQIINNANDGDISFQSDDGSGGTAEYFRLDGGAAITIVSREMRFTDNVAAKFGTGPDLQIYHDGTTSNISNSTGNLSIINQANDSDIKFFSDDGSGGVAEYFRVDGGASLNVFSKDIFLADDKKALFGNNSDLQIYHDGSNSYVKDSGTGNLNIQGDNLLLRRADGSQTYLQALTGSSVSLYHAGNKKLETKSTGINISGVSEYADNAAAIAGGLTTGDVYRTGDLLKIVH